MAQSIPSVASVTGAGFVRGKKRNIEVTRAFEGRKREEAPAKQTLLSTISFARSPRALYQRNKQKNKKKPAPATKVCPAFFPRAANGPRWDLISYPDLTLFYTPFPLDVRDLGTRLGGTSRFIQKPLHPS